MDRYLVYKIDERDRGKKIQDFLRELGCSHHVLTHLKRDERGIVLNGERTFASRRLEAGDVLELFAAETECSDRILPVYLPLSVVYEDEDLMVINKAADTPIHPSVHNHENTLANGVVYYFRHETSPFVYRCVNRLDRDTSGLLIIAKNMLSGAILHQMSARREIHREYLAIAEGLTPASGTVDEPIGRMEGSALRRRVDPEQGDEAVTHFQRLDYRPDLSLLRVRLETGRTHQIRVHMKHIGHPLAGDFLYNPGSAVPMPRQALHSHSLSFPHPITKKPLSFTCEMPEDMRALFQGSL